MQPYDPRFSDDPDALNTPADSAADAAADPLEVEAGDTLDDNGDALIFEDDDADTSDDADDDSDADPVLPRRSRGGDNDAMFGYLLALALSIGLTPLIPVNADLRYALVWGVLALFGVLAWLFGVTTRIQHENAENLAWGVVFGVIVGAPLLLAGGSTLTTTARVLFQTEIGGEIRTLPPGVVLMLLVFVMPLAETLFFRALLQYNRSFWLVGALSSVWAIALFLPMLNVPQFPVVAFIIGVALIMINLIYSYVRQRNGLAAAWLCQIVVNVVVLFVPYLGV